MTTPPLFEPRPWGVNTCGRRIGDGVDCEQPATWHVAWTEDMENGVCCDAHYAEAGERWTVWDSHPFGGFCLMPGTEWIASWERAPGECALPLEDESVIKAVIGAEVEEFYRREEAVKS